MHLSPFLPGSQLECKLCEDRDLTWPPCSLWGPKAARTGWHRALCVRHLQGTGDMGKEGDPGLRAKDRLEFPGSAPGDEWGLSSEMALPLCD